MNGDINPNVDQRVTAGFGDEWSRFDQSALTESQRNAIFNDYFSLFPWDQLASTAVGADFGCGSGRWALAVAPRVGSLYCVDASATALAVAKRNLAHQPNCMLECASVEAAHIAPGSLDFAYSLGVLHHTPDPAAALQACTRYLKVGAPFLVYLYYRFDNRPIWFRLLWAVSDAVRRAISRCPYGVRYLLTQLIACFVYWPLARISLLLRGMHWDTSGLPLAYYADKTFYVMRTDALDRFGTRIEHRFTRSEILRMMSQAGLRDITFRDSPPYWCALGFRL